MLDRMQSQFRRTALLLSVAILLVASGTPYSFGQTGPRPSLHDTRSVESRTPGFQHRVFRDSAGDHKYVLFVPENYSPDRRWPVILYLHGAGERGTDGVIQTTIGLGPFVKARAANFPFFVLFPQCEDTRGPIKSAWSPASPDGRRALAILESTKAEYAIDPQRCILTGWSMGGFGTWNIGAAHPERWSALIPVAGGGDPALAPRLKNVSIWAFAGANDNVVRLNETTKMVDAIRADGGHCLFTVVKNAGHDVWKSVYNDDRLYQWMFLQTAQGAAVGTEGSRSSGPASSGRSIGPARSDRGRGIVTDSATSAQSVTAPPTTGTYTQNSGYRSAPESAATLPGGALPASGPGANAPAPANLEGPFIPAVVIPNAMTVRLGNVALDALAHSAPALIPADALTGRINDIASSTQSSGYSFGVQFSNISYSGQVERVFLKAYAPELLNIQLGLRNVTLMIGSTFVSGSGRSAMAGPIYIVIGHRYPVWLSFDVTPYADNGKLRFRLAGVRFNIPDDDWYVTPPYGVSTRGLGMTQERVSSGLVEGIYGQKYRIESEAASIVPSVLARLESMLDLTQVSDAANAFWPLPVYRPRLRVWPQETRVDENGVSLVMGVVASAADPRKAPPQPETAAPAGATLDSVPSDANLRVALAPGILEPLSRMLIAEDVAHVNVLDIPDKLFANFADRKRLAEVLPDVTTLPSSTELIAELTLAGPITIQDVDGSSNGQPRTENVAPSTHAPGNRPRSASPPPQNLSAGRNGKGVSVTAMKAGSGNGTQAARRLEFVVPKAAIVLSTRTPQDQQWQPYAEFDFDLRQQASAKVVRSGFAKRILQIDWAGDPMVKASGHFAPSYKPKNTEIHADKLHDEFAAAWGAWTKTGPASQVAVPDVDFKYAKLRLDGIEWTPPVLDVLFDEPGIKISNATKSELIYETKGIYSAWSPPIVLPPGKTNFFKIAEPLLFRRQLQDQGVQLYTLPVGTAFEFRAGPNGAPANLYRLRDDAAH